MTTLIIGGSGQLGTAFRKLLADADAPDHRALDLVDIDSLEQKVDASSPSLIINCAAYTAVDEAERDEDTATRVNGEAVGVLARAADGLGIPFVTFSTDYVFDGETEEAYTETSTPNPINVYGRSKLVGERAALEFPGSLVIRTSWLFSSTHPNFVSTILANAAEGEVRVVADQWGTPTPVPALAAMVLEAVSTGTTGLLHLAGRPAATWFTLATHACEIAGIDTARIVACSTHEFPRPARRPRHAALETGTGFAMADWRTELPAIIAQGTNSGLGA